jgi:hypothetical protein
MVLIERARKYKRALEQLRRERELRRAEAKRKRDMMSGGTGSLKAERGSSGGVDASPQRSSAIVTSSRHAPRSLPGGGSRELTLTGSGGGLMSGSANNLRLFEQRRSISMKRLDESSSPIMHGSGPRTNSSMGFFASPPGSPGPLQSGRLALLQLSGGNTPPQERRRLSTTHHTPGM